MNASSADFVKDLRALSTEALAAKYNGSNVFGSVNLSDTDIPHRIELRDVTFADPFLAEDARFTHTVDLSECHFQRGLLLDGAAIAGCLHLREAVIGKLPDAVSLRWRDWKGVAFSGVELNVQAWTNFYRMVVDGKAFLVELKVGGQAEFSGVMIAGDLDLQNAEIGTDFLCTRSTSAAPATEILGTVYLNGSTIGRQAKFSGAKIRGDLILHNAEISADLVCRRSTKDTPDTEIYQNMSLRRTTVGGQVDLSGVNITHVLELENAEIGADLLCHSLTKDWPTPQVGSVVLIRTTVKGRVDFQNATIREGMTFDGSTFSDVTVLLGTDMLGGFQAIRTTFEDGLFLGTYEGGWQRRFFGYQATRCGPINLQHAHVGGELHLVGTVIKCPPSGPCVNLSFATVDGACLLPGNETATELRLYHAQLGEVSFGSTQLPKVVADGMRFRELVLHQNNYIDFLDQTDEFQEANYRIIELHLRNQGQDAEADRVYREMRRRDRREDVGRLLRGIDLGLLWLLSLVGLYDLKAKRLQTLRDQWRARPKDRSLRGGWLGRRLSGVGRIMKWGWGLFLDGSIGYGTQSYRVGLYLLVVFVAFTVAFSPEYSVKRKTGAGLSDLERMKAMRAEPITRPGEVGKSWHTLDAMAMAARVTLPIVEPAVDADWEPSNESVVGFEEGWWKDYTSYETAAGFFRALSFVAVPLFLVSLSGFMKQRGE